jgi:hypothetical protein
MAACPASVKGKRRASRARSPLASSSRASALGPQVKQKRDGDGPVLLSDEGGARAWPTLRSAWLEVRGLLAKKKGIAAVGSKEQ